MEAKRIKCPNCHGVLEVTNPKNETILLITCPNPNCKAKMRVQFDTGETIVAQSKKNEMVPGFLTYKGNTYELMEGKNTIGRSSSKHEAQIEFATDDKSMSRLHCQIEVVKLKRNRMKAVINDLRTPEKIAQRPLCVENEPLAKEDRVVLANGDFILMGRQRIRYNQKPIENED